MKSRFERLEFLEKLALEHEEVKQQLSKIQDKYEDSSQLQRQIFQIQGELQQANFDKERLKETILNDTEFS